MKTAKKYNIILLVLFFIFFGFYNFTNIFGWWPMLSSTGHLIFNWPDATANYFFANIFAHSQQLWQLENLNLLTDNLLHARSINVINAYLVPMTFLPAVVIFGSAWWILGDFGILILTPFLAALSGLLFYRLVYYIFKDLDLAFISALIFWSLAPWVFFANVVMLPNILYISLLLAGGWSLAKSLIFEKSLYWILACLFLSLAVFVRPTEIVYLAVIFIFIIYTNRKKIYFKHYIYGSLIFLINLFLFLSLNKATYGSYFSVGYLNLQSGALPLEFSSQSKSGLFTYIKLLLAPFGFDIIVILKNVYRYFIKILAAHLFLSLIALIILFYKKQISAIWQKYIILTPFVFVIIFIYYGSWDLADPLVKELNNISISYVRYFLPLYIWILPLVALGIKKIFFGHSRINKLSYYIVLLALVLASFKLAFYSKNDGLLQNLENLENYNQQYQAVSEQIEDDAIVISSRSDKVFFPKYRVVVYENSSDIWPRIKNIISQAPIYYYTNQETDVDRVALDKLNLKLLDKGQIWHNFKLYKVIKN